jgi:hypothetical protein
VQIAEDEEIVAVHGRVAAAMLLHIDTVPALRLSHLTEAERRAYVLADNKLALNAGWDREMLAIELQGLVDLVFDIEFTGFSLAEVDIVLDEARDSATDGADTSIEDIIPLYRHDGPSVTRSGDLWVLGRHKLVCGDARDAGAYAALLGDEGVDLIFCTILRSMAMSAAWDASATATLRWSWGRWIGSNSRVSCSILFGSRRRPAATVRSRSFAWIGAIWVSS